MMLGLVLLYVGAVLFLNAVWLLGKISGREVAVINFLVGVLSACVAFYLIAPYSPPGCPACCCSGRCSRHSRKSERDGGLPPSRPFRTPSRAAS